ncbi:MAG: hypothetical protein GY719_13840 [bacterium]|nr:hypothetical protein [bacterium]
MKAILERKKAAAIVTAASRCWAAPTTAEVAELLRPELAEGETLPDLELLQELFGRALARRWQRLESADQAHLRATEDRDHSNGENAAALAKLYRRVVDLRRFLRGVFGGGAARRLLGVAGATSRDALVLLRQAGHAVARLGDTSRGLPSACVELTSYDRSRWAAPVEAAAETLRWASARATGAAKRLEAAVADRRRAIADFNDVFVLAAGWLEGTYRAAGRADRAELVRPSRRRRGRLLQGDDRGPGRRVEPAADESRPADVESHQHPPAVGDRDRQTVPMPAEPPARAVG